MPYAINELVMIPVNKDLEQPECTQETLSELLVISQWSSPALNLRNNGSMCSRPIPTSLRELLATNFKIERYPLT